MLISLPNAFGDAATNMAIDAALLESMPEGLAAFRHYGWLEPTATFGYAQHYQNVVSELASGHRPIESTQASAALSQKRAQASHLPAGISHTTFVRRLTGGGIVDHRDDWTYALVIHSSLPCAATPATTLYEQIHRAISQSLNEMEIKNHLAPCPKACDSPLPQGSSIARIAKEGASQCFVNPAANDVLRLDGQKIAGAAMKRNRYGLLIQGSIDRDALPETFDFIKFQEHLLPQLATALDLPIGKLEDIRPLFNSEQIEHEKQRFSSEAWNQRR
jgi:lipoate-protein ligase A